MPQEEGSAACKREPRGQLADEPGGAINRCGVAEAKLRTGGNGFLLMPTPARAARVRASMDLPLAPKDR